MRAELSMWYGLRKSLRLAPDYAVEAVDVLDSTARKLIIGISGVCLGLPLLIAVTLNNSRAIDLSLLATPAILLASYIALKLLPRQAALLMWQVGLALAVTIFLRGFQEPAFGFFY